MNTLLGPLTGGLLAITGGLLVALSTHRRELTRWRRDTQLKAATELLAALQTVVRHMINLAYQPDMRAEGGREAIARYEDATIHWNSAMYAALLVSPPAVAGLIPALDREVDRLLDAAMERQWTRGEFRQERSALGRTAAQFLALNRQLAGFSSIAMTTVWSWDAPDH